MSQNALTVTYLGDRRELSYNKTHSMRKVLENLGARYEFIDLASTSGRAWQRKVEGTITFLKLFRQCKAGNIVWLSEYKWSLANILLARALAVRMGAKLVGGPHTLEADRLVFTDQRFHRSVLPKRLKLWLRLVTLVDRLRVSCVDITQSYSVEYLERLSQLSFRKSQLGVLFPIGSIIRVPLNGIPDCVEEPGNAGPRIVFWGVASALHGLEILPRAMRILAARGCYPRVMLFSPETSFVRAAMREAEQFGVRAQFTVGDIHLSTNLALLRRGDLAISHLGAADPNPFLRDASESVITNKMFEILDLGLLLIIARTAAVQRVLPASCAVMIQPGSPEDLARAVFDVWTGAIRARDVAEAGKEFITRHYNATVIFENVMGQLCNFAK